MNAPKHFDFSELSPDGLLTFNYQHTNQKNLNLPRAIFSHITSGISRPKQYYRPRLFVAVNVDNLPGLFGKPRCLGSAEYYCSLIFFLESLNTHLVTVQWFYLLLFSEVSNHLLFLLGYQHL